MHVIWNCVGVFWKEMWRRFVHHGWIVLVILLRIAVEIEKLPLGLAVLRQWWCLWWWRCDGVWMDERVWHG